MLTPYYKIVEAPGCGGRVVKQTTQYIKHETVLYSAWAKPLVNSYRELSAGGTTLGISGHNYWFPDTTILGRLLWFVFGS